jgi:hypothetical protein
MIEARGFHVVGGLGRHGCYITVLCYIILIFRSIVCLHKILCHVICLLLTSFTQEYSASMRLVLLPLRRLIFFVDETPSDGNLSAPLSKTMSQNPRKMVAVVYRKLGSVYLHTLTQSSNYHGILI